MSVKRLRASRGLVLGDQVEHQRAIRLVRGSWTIHDSEVRSRRLREPRGGPPRGAHPLPLAKTEPTLLTRCYYDRLQLMIV